MQLSLDMQDLHFTEIDGTCFGILVKEMKNQNCMRKLKQRRKL